MAHNVEVRPVDGNQVYYDKDGNEIFTIDGTNRKVTFPSGAVLDVDAATTILSLPDGQVGAAKLTSNLKKGFINLDLFSAQIIGSNEIPDAGNFLDGNTDPEIKRVNAATDKQAHISWAATSVIEVQLAPFAYPPDLDDTAPVVVNLLARMAAGGMDTPVVAVGYFEGIGDTNAGGNTSALSTTLAQKTVSIAAGDVGAYPKSATVTITPAAHANEALELYAVWIEYTRRD